MKNPYHSKWFEELEWVVHYFQVNKEWPNSKFVRDDGFKVGKWMVHQRHRLKKGKLPQWRKQILDEYGFPWYPRKLWIGTYIELQKWIQAHGRLPFAKDPRSDKTEKRLYKWYLSQRHYIKKGELSTERIALLKQAGVLYNYQDKIWFENFDKIVNYVKTHQKIPTVATAKNQYEKKLAVWRAVNLALIKKGTLNETRKTLFLQAGLDKNNRSTEWRKGYEKITNFINQHKRFPSVSTKDKYEYALAGWRYHQNMVFNEGLMDKEKSELFRAAGLSANLLQKKWSETFKKVVRFKKLYGHLPAYKNGTTEECKLADWCQKQRIYVKQNIFTSAQKKTLLASAGIFDKSLYKDRWKESFDKFEAFYNENNRLPKLHSSGLEKRLYNWLVVSHWDFSTGKMPQHRVKLFKNYAGKHIPRRDLWQNLWNQQYLRFSAFCKEFNRIPRYCNNIREKKCFSWMAYQRYLIRKGTIAEKRKTLFVRAMNQYRN